VLRNCFRVLAPIRRERLAFVHLLVREVAFFVTADVALVAFVGLDFGAGHGVFSLASARLMRLETCIKRMLRSHPDDDATARVFASAIRRYSLGDWNVVMRTQRLAELFGSFLVRT
jgi:hypothetical protein